MKNSTTKSKIEAVLRIILPIIFWCLVWEILAGLIGHSFILPGIGKTLKALGSLITQKDFYLSVFLTLIRVIIGLILGIIVGTLLAVLCYRVKPINYLFSPLITIIKSTPVASFIVVLWIMMSADALSVFIAFLMVMPIIWQNVTDGYLAVDKGLNEVCEVYNFSPSKRFRLLIFPTLKRYLIPGIITASGLAWKAEIAAEIIAYTKHSIGQGINDAKSELNTPSVFAWTVVIILFSIVLEKLTKYVLRRFSSES